MHTRISKIACTSYNRYIGGVRRKINTFLRIDFNCNFIISYMGDKFSGDYDIKRGSIISYNIITDVTFSL